MPSRIGIYPGSFDSIHKGHIAFSQAALNECNLEQVVLLPEHHPRNKTNITPLRQRAERIKKETTLLPGVQIATLRSKQFTVKQTLAELRELYGDAELTLLVGSDVLQTMHAWPNIATLLQDVSLAVGVRKGSTKQEILYILRHLEAMHEKTIRYTVIETPYAHLASTHIREQQNTVV